MDYSIRWEMLGLKDGWSAKQHSCSGTSIPSVDASPGMFSYMRMVRIAREQNLMILESLLQGSAILANVEGASLQIDSWIERICSLGCMDMHGLTLLQEMLSRIGLGEQMNERIWKILTCNRHKTYQLIPKIEVQMIVRCLVSLLFVACCIWNQQHGTLVGCPFRCCRRRWCNSTPALHRQHSRPPLWRAWLEDSDFYGSHMAHRSISEKVNRIGNASRCFNFFKKVDIRTSWELQ